MHTTGLVLTVADPHTALGELAAAGPFTWSEPVGRRIPAVMEVADSHAARWWHDWVASRPGVEGVEVVFVCWDDFEDTDA
jgi:hypothetical protein